MNSDKKENGIELSDSEFSKYLEHLSALIKIPSVSFLEYPKQPLYDAAEFCKQLFQNCFDRVEFIEKEGVPPWIYAERIISEQAPTLLLYAHYDVQPELNTTLWNSAPFEPTTREGRLYGRGSADDKAGVILHYASVQKFLTEFPDAKINFKVILEGEEEIGSPNLEYLLSKHSELLSCDAVIVADLASPAVGIPGITTSLRGMASLELEITTMKKALHSGLWGGPLPDPALILSKVLSQLTNDQGELMIPGIYEDVIPLSATEKASFQSGIFKKDQFAIEAELLEGTPLTCEEKDIAEKLWRAPTLNINSMQAGNRKTAGNVLMHSAWTRLGLRLAPGMDAEKSIGQLEAFLISLIPEGISYTLKKDHGANPWMGNAEHPMVKAILDAYSEGFNTQALIVGCGASIPGAQLFEKYLDQPVVLLTPVEDPQTNAHSENESLHLGDFKKAIKSQKLFFQKIAQPTIGQ
jgi:acetylornithine deacetylase/succinyl-diaminopimelate desuccinylase-like protein